MRPDHLREHAPELKHKAWALLALATGVLAFIVAAVTPSHIFESPDPRISIPGFAMTLAAGVTSWLRRERAYPFWLAGVGLALAAMVLGWFLMLAIVIGATVVVIAILHAVL